MGKVHPGLQAFADELVLRKFLAVVKRQRLAPRLVRAQQIDNLVAHRLAVATEQRRCQGIAGLALYQG